MLNLSLFWVREEPYESVVMPTIYSWIECRMKPEGSSYFAVGYCGMGRMTSVLQADLKYSFEKIMFLGKKFGLC